MHINKENAWEVVTEYVKDPGLRRHMLAVGAAMRWYAKLLQYDPDYWEGVGILHDFDWEIHPTLDKHPQEGAVILREKGVDPETVRVILSHYTEGTGVPREKPIDFALLACDEITGLIIATALVRPSKDLRARSGRTAASPPALSGNTFWAPPTISACTAFEGSWTSGRTSETCSRR